ncbi:uncharacterized protein LOC111087026 [Limulus polyphemus]|uniref:Uncharacterized protein LOC111087026 n=1 Tax=Limulus polyphemus TaxID=6850 RepID=A0ABM1SW54_LIMPO|nr:uncharacterized protein LOC111087026 [Limulus polyphemus]
MRIWINVLVTTLLITVVVCISDSSVLVKELSCTFENDSFCGWEPVSTSNTSNTWKILNNVTDDLGRNLLEIFSGFPFIVAHVEKNESFKNESWPTKQIQLESPLFKTTMMPVIVRFEYITVDGATLSLVVVGQTNEITLWTSDMDEIEQRQNGTQNIWKTGIIQDLCSHIFPGESIKLIFVANLTSTNSMTAIANIMPSLNPDLAARCPFRLPGKSKEDSEKSLPKYKSIIVVCILLISSVTCLAMAVISHRKKTSRKVQQEQKPKQELETFDYAKLENFEIG